jgi:hypothetical protein
MSNGDDYSKSCKFGCGATVTMSTRSGKGWAAYNGDGSYHKCAGGIKATAAPPAAGTAINTQQQQQFQQNLEQQAREVNKVPRVTINLTRCWESADLPEVCALHQVFVNVARDYGATIFGTAYHFSETKGTYSMVCWLEIPKNNLSKLEGL